MDSATTTVSRGINKRESGFKNKHHDLATKNRISQTQKKRYALLNQMVRQHQQNEESHIYGPLFNLDNPEITQKIKDIVRELLKEEIQKAIPIRRNIPIF